MAAPDEKRIILMTRMASFEASEKKKLVVSKYYRSDFVTFNMLKTGVCVTIAYIIIMGIRVFCDIDQYLSDIYKADWQGLFRMILTRYVIVLAVYLAFAFVLYSIRYTKAKSSVRVYQRALKKLISMYSSSGRNSGQAIQ